MRARKTLYIHRSGFDMPDCQVHQPAKLSSPVIQFSGVGKTYRENNTCVLEGLDIVVEKGETLALIGANGAGKTTAVKCLLGFIEPSEGAVYIYGKRLRCGDSRQDIAYLPERFQPPPQLTGQEFLAMLASVRKGGGQKPRIVEEALQRVGLVRAAHQCIRTYSKGMMQRLGIAQLLLSQCHCLVLDEPSSGLDPMGRHQIRHLLAELKAAGHTLILSTHALSDVEALADRVILLSAGRMRYVGSVAALLERHGVSTLEEAFMAEQPPPEDEEGGA